MAKFGTPSSFSSFWRNQRVADEQLIAPLGELGGHFPYVRPLLLGWELTPTGYRSASRHPEHFEVICVGCGDGDGPAELQPAPARALRGPYGTEKAAAQVANAHERAELPTRREVKAATGGGFLRVFFPSTKLSRAMGAGLRGARPRKAEAR